ncbi:MAG: GHKL domain-containing protein [Oscillospiraceae bacterium]
MYTLITILNEVIQLGISLYYLTNFLDKRVAKKEKVFLVISFYMIISFISYKSSPVIITAVCFFASFTIAFLLYKSSLTQAIWISITYVLIGLISEAIAATILTFFMEKQIGLIMANATYKAVVMLVSKAILFLIVKIIVIKFSKKFALASFQYSISLMIFPILAILNVYLIIYMQFQIPYNKLFAAVSLTVGIILLLMSFLNMQTLSYKIQKIENEHELQREKEKNAADIEIIKNHENSIKDLRMVTHDFKNHLLALNMLYRNNDLSYQEYYKDIINVLDEKIRNTYEGINNSTISNIMYSTHRKCTENNIKLNVKIFVDDLSFISPMISNVIFSNLIDNAIKACLDLSNDEARHLQIDIYHSGYFIVIEMKNSFSGVVEKDKEKLLSTKGDTQNHGYGLDIVKNTVYQNGGSMLIEYNDNEFLVTLSFPHT